MRKENKSLFLNLRLRILDNVINGWSKSLKLNYFIMKKFNINQKKKP
jgi:hypothetical protein